MSLVGEVDVGLSDVGDPIKDRIPNMLIVI
jgi:hypothetical protein